MSGLIRELVVEALLAPLAFVAGREASTLWVAAHGQDTPYVIQLARAAASKKWPALPWAWKDGPEGE